MKQLIKGFREFVNESQAPSHNLLRNLHAEVKNPSAEKPFDHAKVHKSIEDLGPEESDRFKRLAARTKDWRNKDVRWDRALAGFLNAAWSQHSHANVEQKADEINDIKGLIGPSRDEQEIKRIVADYYGVRPTYLDFIWDSHFDFMNENNHEMAHSRHHNHSTEEILSNQRSYDDSDWGEYSNLADWLESAQGDDPDNNGIEVKDAVDAVCADCMMDPNDVMIHGVLTSRAASLINSHEAEKLDTPAYPGAPIIHRYSFGNTIYYVIGMYDGDIVASCSR